jgi:hypothetical protein
VRKLMNQHRSRRFLLAIALVVILLTGDYSEGQSQTQLQSSSNAASADAGKEHSQHTRCDDKGTYKNRDGRWVPSPENCSSPPAEATARCRDGTYSFSRHRSGTCSHHGGVAQWL